MKNLFMSMLLMLAAAPALSGAEMRVETASGWQRDGDGYVLDYPGTGWPMLTVAAAAEEDTFYLLSWQAKCSPELAEQELFRWLEIDGRKANRAYGMGTEWTDYHLYFHSQKEQPARIQLYLNPGPAGRLFIRLFRLTPSSGAALRENLLPNGDFEIPGNIAGDWRKMNKVKGNPASVAPMADFIAGEKSLALDFTDQGEVPVGVSSLPMPMTFGQTYEFRFWAKAEKDFALRAAISVLSESAHKGEHFYQARTFKITPEWKRYVVAATIPTDLARYPDLAERLVYVAFNGNPGSVGKVWIDDCAFIMKDGDSGD